MPTRREMERRERQRRGENPAFPEGTGDAGVDAGAEDGTLTGQPDPAIFEADAAGTAAYDPNATESHAGRPDQDVTNNTGTGAGGATEFGRGVKDHPSRITSRPPGNQ